MHEYQYSEASDHTEVPVSGSIGDRNTNDTPDYVSTMDIYVKNIDKNDNNTWITIYKAIDEPYFGGVKLFTKSFLNHCQNHPNDPQKIPTEINKKINPPLEKILYVQVFMIRWKRMFQEEKMGKN